ncbi:Cytochrome c oxidase subunit 6C family-containing protein [Strongyloides ratti]|uniref:Cytochrome c oxidase subunit 6C family-containing protein n=1 Tax=Strongyloides ratti TaxID=34506 RepID=A0A090L8U9_STRRB|nr:Cytochrome c oxidase subunit 6C family-containing protein [Strongyloides ratti]CEF63935.1 Cytochrome c oxidase subunit 6C family-containing protein [Strongyloides ratti]
MAPVMRNMLHSNAKKALYYGLATAFASTVVCYFTYVKPRQTKYEEFFANYDPYKRMREICETGKGYLHTCPQELAKLYEEKGIPIGSKLEATVGESDVAFENVTAE